MVRRLREYWVLVACDGKEFPDTADGRSECQAYESGLRGPAKLRVRLQELVQIMNRLKRGGPVFYHSSLRTKVENLRAAKKRLLEAAKGKRRHTVEFAKAMEKAAHDYLEYKRQHDDALAAFNDARKEYLEIKKELAEKEKAA